MQKRTTKTSRNKWKIALPVLVLLVAGGVAGILIHKHNDSKSAAVTAATKTVGKRSVNSISYAPSTKADNAANETRKSNPSTASTSLDNGATTTSSSSPSSSSSNITITNAHESNTDQIAASANITGSTSGTCKFTATMNGEPTASSTDSVELSSNGDYYVCGPDDINVATDGNWTISVSLIDNGSTLATNSWAANPVTVD